MKISFNWGDKFVACGWNPTAEKFKGNYTFKLDAGTYYLRIFRGLQGLSAANLSLGFKSLDDNGNNQAVESGSNEATTIQQLLTSNHPSNNNNNIPAATKTAKGKTPFLTSPITPWMRFTSTFVPCDGGGYYVISYADGNLYLRDNDKEQFILESVKEVYATGKTYFALKNDGSLWGWGDNSVGQLGDNTGINKTLPIKIMDNVRNISMIGGSIFAVKNDGAVYAWGSNSTIWGNNVTIGTLGVGDHDNRYEPVKLPLENVLYVDANYLGATLFITAVTLSGNEYQWGKNSSVPKLVGKHDYNVYFSGHYYDFATGSKLYKLTPNGKLYSGNLTPSEKTTPREKVYSSNDMIASNVALVETFGRGGLYITKSGDLYRWGDAPIGDGSNIPRKNPVLVLQNVIQANSEFALTSQGELYAIDDKNTFKYERVMNGYLPGNSCSWYGGDGYRRDTNILPGGYLTNDGSLYNAYPFEKPLLKDVALPQLKYEIKPQ